MKKLLLIAATALWFAGCSERSEGVSGPQEGVAIAFSLDCGDLSASVGAAQAGAAETGAAAQIAQAPQPAQPVAATPAAARNAAAPSAAQTAALPAPAQNAVQTRAAVPIASGTTVRIVALPAGAALGSTPAASATYCVTGEETVDGRQRATLTPCSVTNDATTGAVTACSADATKAMRLKVGTYDFYAYSPALPLKSDGKSVDVYHGMDFAASKTAGVVIGSDGSTSYPDPTASTSPAKTGVSGAVELQSLARKCSYVRFSVTRTDEAAALVTSVSVDHLKLSKIAASPVSAEIASDITPVAALSGSHTFVNTMFSYPDQTNKPYELVGGDAVLPKVSGELEFSGRVRFNNATTDDNQPKYSDLGPVTLGAVPFSKGVRYTYTLKLKGDAILVILSVGAWNLADDLTADFGPDEVVPGIVVGAWTNVDWSAELGGGTTPDFSGEWTLNPAWSTELGAYLNAVASSGQWNTPADWSADLGHSDDKDATAGASDWTTETDWNDQFGGFDNGSGAGTDASDWTAGTDWSDSVGGFDNGSGAGAGTSGWTNNGSGWSDNFGVMP